MVNELNKNMVKELKKESETWEIRKNLQYVGNMVKEERVFVDGKWVNKTPHKNQFWNGERDYSVVKEEILMMLLKVMLTSEEYLN